MPYVSDLLGKHVCDGDGRKIGYLRELVASAIEAMPHPVLAALEVRSFGRTLLVPASEAVSLVAPTIPLAHALKDIEVYEPGANDLFLVRDILDQQIIDVNDVRVVRVNDIELARVNGKFYIANVDIGTLGLLRRLGLLKIIPWLGMRSSRSGLPAGTISWDDVEPIAKNRRLRLKVPGEKITDLHPADLAEILSDLSRSEGSKLLESLDPKTAAGALEEVEPDFQASLVKEMPDEKVATVLEEMAPDEAADLLGELPEERSKTILKKMEKDSAEDIRKLLSFPDDSAGGIMTTEFFTVRPDRTAAQALKTIRETARDMESLFYVYVIDRKGLMMGAFSLKDLVMADPRARVETIMDGRILTVNLRDSQDTVAQVVSKYNLLAVPVVDDDGRMQGIVTADDALDKIIPTAWKKRLPRLYH